MKTSTKHVTFLAAVALGVAILLGQALPSQAQAATGTQPHAQATSAPAGWHGGGYGPHGPHGGGCGW